MLSGLDVETLIERSPDDDGWIAACSFGADYIKIQNV